MPTLKIAGATLNQTPIDWANNLENIKEAIDQAKADNVEILCLPELCITGYGCEDLFLSQWVYKKSLGLLERIRPWCKDILVAIGIPIHLENVNYNCTCIIYDQQYLGIYAKQNMALDGVHYEPRWFKPWPSEKAASYSIAGMEVPFGDIIIEHQGIKIGFEICEDAWRQERPACRLYEKGVDMIMNPSASHFAFGKTLLREDLVVSSSKNFNCTYVFANLLGNEAGRMIYDGEILIARKGELIARNKWLSFKNVNLVSADVDFSAQATYPPIEYDRNKNTEFVKAVSLALFDYLRKSRSHGFVLSLSGGADSSTTAVLVSEMVRRGIDELGISSFIHKIGLKRTLAYATQLNGEEAAKFIVSKILTTAYQGTKNSSEDTQYAAKALADEIGAEFHSWLIDEEVSSYTETIEKAIGRKLTWEHDDITLQNIQARARSPIIWMLANLNNALLLTTSNRSEGDVGYTTMDGDTSGSIAPIAGVDKHFIVNWLMWAEKELGYPSLRYVNSLKPSAELRPQEHAQTDETDLMPYAIMVKIERLAIRHGHSPLEVYEKLSIGDMADKPALKKYIKKFFKLWSRNQWKRERIAPSFHLDEFNVDPRSWYRFPILSHGFSDELSALDKA